MEYVNYKEWKKKTEVIDVIMRYLRGREDM
jgi:hypothetical protein